MKKIGILTYHNTMNYGAALQCFALYDYVKGLGHDVEIIDYRNEFITRKSSLIKVNNQKNQVRNIISLGKALAALPLKISKKNKFKSFNKKLSFSNKFYNKGNIDSLANRYDVFLLGSDQVWNYKLNGADKTYFFDFVDDNSKKVSYASSFGTIDIPQENELALKEYLSKFRKISVRETTGKNIINRLTKQDVDVVLDPVFLFDKEYWTKFTNSQNEDYVLIYIFLNKHYKECSKLLNTEKLLDNKIYKLVGGISVKDSFSKRVKVVYKSGPENFLSYIKYSKLVFTDSFHAVVFSIIFNKSFFVYLTGDKGRDSRIIELLESVGLTNRIITESNTDSIIDEEIAWDKVNLLIEPIINDSRNYLIETLNYYNGK